MERYIAVDNVCAWPNLTRLADQTIIASIFNQPTHGGWEGDVECWASQDEGRSWQLRGIPAPHEPTTNRMNVAAGEAADGSLIVLASGWSDRCGPGDYSSPHQGVVLPAWVCRSEDGGRSWRRSESMPAPKGLDHVIPFGDIVRMEDELGVCGYAQSGDGVNSAHFYASTDGGRSWRVRGIIRDRDANETTPVFLPDGRLLAAARTREDGHLALFESGDAGRCWSHQGALTLPGQHPGHLLLLDDGRLLLTYGIRNPGLYGVGARISTDEGNSWEAPRVIVNLTGERPAPPANAQSDTAWYQRSVDAGYPASTQNEDGTIVTAYYCNGIPSHQRYHMGAVRWSTA